MKIADIYSKPLLLRIDTLVLVSILFLSMMLFIALGSFIAKQRRNKPGYIENPANNTIYGAVFGLLAFLLAFTFSMSGSRFENRRQASLAEGNAIGTAILRADMFPDSERTAFRADFKNYLQARINIITAGTNVEKIIEEDKQASLYSARLWKRAMDISKNNPNAVAAQMIVALNEMFDSGTTNTYSEAMRVPQSIVLMLFILSVIAAFFVGYISVGKGRFDWLIGTGFCLLSSLVIFITLDLDRPRSGLIQLDTSHEAIISLMSQF